MNYKRDGFYDDPSTSLATCICKGCKAEYDFDRHGKECKWCDEKDNVKIGSETPCISDKAKLEELAERVLNTELCGTQSTEAIRIVANVHILLKKVNKYILDNSSKL